MPETRSELREIEQLRQELAQLTQMVRGSGDRYHVPDPIKQLSEFTGNKKELNMWIDEVDELFDTFKVKGEGGNPDTLNIHYVRAIKNKIKGDARITLCASGNPSTIPEIKRVLLQHYGDQRDIATNINSLFSVKKGDRGHQRFYNDIKEIETKIKANLALNPLTAGELLEKMVITKYLDNIGEPLASIIRNNNPTSLEAAFQSVMLNQNAEVRSKNMNVFKPSSSAPRGNADRHTAYWNKSANVHKTPAAPSTSKPSYEKKYDKNWQPRPRIENNNNEANYTEEEEEIEEDQLVYPEEEAEINFHSNRETENPS